MSKSWKRRLAFSIKSPLFIAWIVAWVMFNWDWSKNRSAQQPSLLRVGFESLFPWQLPATNRAFVIPSILVDYFYIEWAHIIIYIIITTWLGQTNQYEVRMGWCRYQIFDTSDTEVRSKNINTSGEFQFFRHCTWPTCALISCN